MDQSRYWMYRRPGLISSNLQASTKASYDDSWEEQAFAEDASGALGGCVWPPRSYSCSFCGREFASAQALGGHMNVHRRDRARLKQSPTSQDEVLHHDHQHSPNQIQKHFLPMGFQYQTDEVCNFVYNPNPNSNHATLPSPSSTSKEISCPEPTLVPPFSSQIAQDHPIKSPESSPKSWSNFVADRYYHFSDLWNEGEKSPGILESGSSTVKEGYVRTDLSVCLNLIVRRTPPTTYGIKEEIGCKRKRSDTALLPFFVKPISIERHHLQPAEVSELSPISDDDDIDLELRLGPRVHME